MDEKFEYYDKQLSNLLNFIRYEIYDNINSSKNDLLKASFILDDYRNKIMSIEHKAYVKLTHDYPNDPEVWYLYSKFILLNKGNAQRAYSYAKKSISILNANSETVSAFSRHFIVLAIENKEFHLAQLELIRISELIELTLEQKKYFIDSLEVLKSMNLLPDIYVEALSNP